MIIFAQVFMQREGNRGSKDTVPRSGVSDPHNKKQVPVHKQTIY